MSKGCRRCANQRGVWQPVKRIQADCRLQPALHTSVDTSNRDAFAEFTNKRFSLPFNLYFRPKACVYYSGVRTFTL